MTDKIASMTLTHKYDLKILGKHLSEVSIVSEWNGFIELRGSEGKIIVKRKNWNNGKEWAKEKNAFIEQELEVIYADKRFGLPETKTIFSPPSDK